MSNADDLAIVARVRRAMPRNADVMRLCEIAERLVLLPEHAQAKVAPVVQQPFDKKTYQREYMRKRRRGKGKT